MNSESQELCLSFFTEGRVSVERMQERVGTIQQLKEALREEEKQENSEKSDYPEQVPGILYCSVRLRRTR
jgi:hypothetical protein